MTLSFRGRAQNEGGTIPDRSPAREMAEERPEKADEGMGLPKSVVAAG